jgi:hypothetical protein
VLFPARRVAPRSPTWRSTLDPRLYPMARQRPSAEHVKAGFQVQLQAAVAAIYATTCARP